MVRDIFAETSDDIAPKPGVLPGHVAVVTLYTQYLTSALRIAQGLLYRKCCSNRRKN